MKSIVFFRNIFNNQYVGKFDPIDHPCSETCGQSIRTFDHLKIKL